MLVLSAHLVWDEGYGEGWTESDFYELDEAAARELLFGTVDAVVRRYRGRVAAWIVANEVFDGFGIVPRSRGTPRSASRTSTRGSTSPTRRTPTRCR